MKVALVGYGKMGKLIERVVHDAGHSVITRLGRAANADGAGLRGANLRPVDVAIEFTTPEAAPANLEVLAQQGVRTVCGTTGWFEHLPRIRAAFERSGTPLVYGANMSIGMNVTFELARTAARLFARFAEYAPWLLEHHHAAKRDAPSGTGAVLTDILRAHYGARTPECLSVRAGHAPGMHELSFDGPADRVTLRHEARNREGFARGALFAAERISGVSGVLSFSELLLAE